jgi:hypothetical protein
MMGRLAIIETSPGLIHLLEFARFWILFRVKIN